MTKKEAELWAFESMASLAKLILLPNTIQQKDPPAPDIECQIQDFGPLAVELLALDASTTRERLGNRETIPSSWEPALEQWSDLEQKSLRASCKDVRLTISGGEKAGKHDQVQLMRSIQEKLLTKSSDFFDELLNAPTRLNVSSPHCRSIIICRRDFITNGPSISAQSSGRWEMPRIEKIEEKLTSKEYQTSAPLDLFAYSTHDGVDEHVDSLAKIDACVEAHLKDSRFRRVLVFDLAIRKMQLMKNREYP